MEDFTTNLYNYYYMFLFMILLLTTSAFFYLLIKRWSESSIFLKFGILALAFSSTLLMLAMPTFITPETKTVTVKNIKFGNSLTIYDENGDKYIVDNMKLIQKGDKITVRKDFFGNWYIKN